MSILWYRAEPGNLRIHCLSCSRTCQAGKSSTSQHRPAKISSFPSTFEATFQPNSYVKNVVSKGSFDLFCPRPCRQQDTFESCHYCPKAGQDPLSQGNWINGYIWDRTGQLRPTAYISILVRLCERPRGATVLSHLRLQGLVPKGHSSARAHF